MKREIGFVNVEVVDKTIEEIKKSHRFDMDTWNFCILAHAVRAAYRAEDGGRMWVSSDMVMEGAKLFNLDLDRAQDLFCTGLKDPRDKELAIRVLEILRDTGEVDWEVASRSVVDSTAQTL